MIARNVPLAVALPVGARRLILYSFFDSQGRVDAFVLASLRGLRPHAAELIVVVNGNVDDDGRQALETVADRVLTRENTGLDIGAHRDALERLADELSSFDEIVMTNDTWYGPVRPWGPIFAQMAARAVHFWGLTDHASVARNPLTGRRGAPYHLQSYWIAVRRDMFLSRHWRRYWSSLGSIDTYVDAVVRHELRFTRWFSRHGWRSGVVFGCEAYTTENPSLFEARELIGDGCPALKRRALFHWPPLLASRGATGPASMQAAVDAGYPADLILANLARTVPPRTTNLAAGLHSVVLPSSSPPADDAPFGRLLIVAECGGDKACVDRLSVRLAGLMPGLSRASVVVVTPAAGELHGLAQLNVLGFDSVRVHSAKHAHSGLASLAFCGEPGVLDGYDIVLRLGSDHQSRTPDRRLEHALADPFTRGQVASYFGQETGLGVVYAPLDHAGNDIVGHGWCGLRQTFLESCGDLDIHVPPDDVTPLAPFGGSYLFRPTALRAFFQRAAAAIATHEASPDLLYELLQLMPSYAAGEHGFHTRTVMSVDDFALSHPLLEYEVGEMSAMIPGETFEKIDYLRHSGPLGDGSPRDLVRMYMRRRHMRVVHLLRRLMDPSRAPGSWVPRRRGRN